MSGKQVIEMDYLMSGMDPSIYDRIRERSLRDSEYRSRLEADPARVLREEGVAVPDGLEIKVLDFDPSRSYLFLPPRLKSSNATTRGDPFDLTKVPDVMDKMGWPVGARLMRRWFEGPASGSPPDTSTVTMRWVLGFQRARNKVDAMLREKIYCNPGAQLEIANLIYREGKQRGGAFGDFWKPMELLDKDYVNYRVINSWDCLPGGLDDLVAALGSFPLRVVVKGNVVREPGWQGIRSLVRITHVGVYVRDSFDFNGSQYLGYWDTNTLKASFAPFWGGRLLTNDHFRVWRDEHRKVDQGRGKGGDFLIFSDLYVVALAQPETFILPEWRSGTTRAVEPETSHPH